MENKTPKLRALAIREIRLARPSKTDLKKASAAISTLSRTLDSVDELRTQPDLLHVEAVLVTEGINDNDDAFTRDELKLAISSPILKPMNWQHKDENILGAMYAVEARDLQGNVLKAEEIEDQTIELVIQGVIWHQLPHIKSTAEQIVQRIEKDDLFVSMECWFDNYDYGLYTQAGELFDCIARKPETAFLDAHLRVNGGTGKYNGMRIGRALSGINFGGVAFVDRPANKRSFILNHFAFDPLAEVVDVEASRDGLKQDQAVTQTTLLGNEQEPTEVTMNDLNRAAASNAEEIAKGVEQAFEARERANASQRTVADLASATARNAELEKQLEEAKAALVGLQTAIDQAHSGATTDTPAEIAKIDQALTVKGPGAGDAVYSAKIAWLADSRKAIADAHVNNKDVEADTKLIEENKTLKAEIDGIKKDLRQGEIEHLFATRLEMTEEEVKKFVEAGLSKETDEAYDEWFDEKLVFAKKMFELKKGKKKDKKADDAEAGLLAPSQRETSIEDEGAVLRSDHGRAPADIPRVPRSKLTAAADLDAMFEEVDEPNLAGANAEEGSDGKSPMGYLVAGLLKTKNDTKKEV
ncbi:MAG: hypothetical protein V3T23_08395 [Nitrososphaerales archaeon]